MGGFKQQSTAKIACISKDFAQDLRSNQPLKIACTSKGFTEKGWILICNQHIKMDWLSKNFIAKNEDM